MVNSPSSSLSSLSSYDYDLPEKLIAQYPIEPRDQSRLLVVRRDSGSWEHKTFSDLPSILDPSDLLVANNTSVLRARLLGKRVLEGKDGREELGGKIEFLMLERKGTNPDDHLWEGAFHAAAKHKPGVRFWIPTPDGMGLRGELVRGASESPAGTVVARFDRDPVESGAGHIPLPHYIDREGETGDESRYQTVYAKKLGSAAAPTAGLHFTPRVLEALREKGVHWRELTLHVGIGTFRPVKTEDVRQHHMHEEGFEISQDTARDITDWKRQGRRVLAVGTTSVRTLESAWDPETNALRSGPGRTSIFIYPGSRPFHVVDRLLTNFHLPKSTLLMLVCAFGGQELILEAYRAAVRENYRFFSYGDAMLVL